MEMYNKSANKSSSFRELTGGHFILFIHLAVYKILNVENVAASRLAELHGKRTKFIS